MGGYYGFERDEIAGVFRRVLATAHITIEHRDEVERAVVAFEQGFDFADALHHASYRECSEMASFDDKKFVRRANRRISAISHNSRVGFWATSGIIANIDMARRSICPV